MLCCGLDDQVCAGMWEGVPMPFIIILQRCADQGAKVATQSEVGTGRSKRLAVLLGALNTISLCASKYGLCK